MCCGGDLILTLMADEIGTQKEEMKKVSQVDRRPKRREKDSLILIPYASAGALEGGDEGCELLKC
jgi:hypothetical protein